jgi:hypothetical protein
MRPAFQTRQILLRSQQQLDTLLFLIPNLPLDADKPLEVIIREQVKQRGLSQNALYWMRLHEIAEQGWFQGKLYSSDVWHEYSKKHIMPEEIITKDGEIMSKWVESPDGSRVVISTTQLAKACFAEYTEMVEAFGAGLGVRFKEKGYE